MNAFDQIRELKHHATVNIEKRRKAMAELQEAKRATEDAERRVESAERETRSVTLELARWQRRAEAAEAKLRSMGYAA